MRSIGKKLIRNYLSISLFIVFIMLMVFVVAITQYYIGGVERVLITSAENTASFCSKNAPLGDINQKSKYIFENMDEQMKALIELVDLEGNVIIDNTGASSIEEIDTYDYYQALKGKTGVWRGESHNGEPIMAASAPLYDGQEVIGVIRYVSTLDKVYKTIFNILFTFAVIGLLVLIVTAVTAIVMARTITIPIKELTRVTNEISQGNFKVSAFKYNNDEIGQLADAINIMSREIAKSDQAKNEFISSISHELRTPLTSIKGWAETLQEFPDESEMVEEGLQIINGETDRLIVLVNDLLDFSRLQSNRLELKMDEFQLDDLLEELYRQFSIRAKKEHIRLILDLNDDGTLIMGDYGRLKQVFINILDNAMKFTEGKNNASIIINTTLEEEWLYITVEDNGSGISNEDLIRVKEKFYKGTSKKSGTGLGLSIATEIVEKHGGKLWIESVYGEGTVITISLPLFYEIVEEDRA